MVKFKSSFAKLMHNSSTEFLNLFEQTSTSKALDQTIIVKSCSSNCPSNTSTYTYDCCQTNKCMAPVKGLCVGICFSKAVSLSVNRVLMSAAFFMGTNFRILKFFQRKLLQTLKNKHFFNKFTYFKVIMQINNIYLFIKF